MNNPILAGNDALTLSAPTQLFAGDAPVTTNRAQGGTLVNLAKWTVIAIVADKIVAWDPTGSGDVTKAAGILTTDLNTVAQPGSWAPYYTGGDFNAAALVWPASIDTLAERRAAFAQTDTIKISTVL